MDCTGASPNPHGFGKVPRSRKRVQAALEDAGLRVHLDNRDDMIGFKIREAHNAKVPWMAIVGEQELEDDSVSLRLRTDLRGQGIPPNPSVDEFVQLVSTDATRPF